MLLFLFFLIHYLAAGRFSPHKWAGFAGGGLFVLALLLLMMGVVGDMLNRHRIYLEELLYHLRSRQSDSRQGDSRKRP